MNQRKLDAFHAALPLRGCPHGNAILCKHTFFASFWPIVHMDPVNTAPENTLFWNRVSGWKNSKMLPSRFSVDSESTYFPKHWRHHPRHLASDLWTPWCLITTTTTADYMLMVMLQKRLSLSSSWVWVAAAVQPHFWSPKSAFGAQNTTELPGDTSRPNPMTE